MHCTEDFVLLRLHSIMLIIFTDFCYICVLVSPEMQKVTPLILNVFWLGVGDFKRRRRHFVPGKLHCGLTCIVRKDGKSATPATKWRLFRLGEEFFPENKNKRERERVRSNDEKTFWHRVRARRQSEGPKEQRAKTNSKYPHFLFLPSRYWLGFVVNNQRVGYTRTSWQSTSTSSKWHHLKYVFF